MKKLIIKAPTWSQLSFFFFCLECEATLDDNSYYFQLAMKLSMVDIKYVYLIITLWKLTVFKIKASKGKHQA